MSELRQLIPPCRVDCFPSTLLAMSRVLQDQKEGQELEFPHGVTRTSVFDEGQRGSYINVLQCHRSCKGLAGCGRKQEVEY
jgi:hypothetical protein